MKQRLELSVNNEEHEVFVDPWLSLAEVLRGPCGLTGTKLACNTGNCGSCVTLVDGRAVKSCLMLGPQAEGKEITTIEGLANGDKLHPVQQSFVDKFAAQCGFCIPGMIMSAVELLQDNPDPNEDEITDALQGNLCPCVLHASPQRIREEVGRWLESYGKGPGHVFNLGHGIHPDVNPDHAAALVEAVHDLSPPYH